MHNQYIRCAFMRCILLLAGLCLLLLLARSAAPAQAGSPLTITMLSGGARHSIVLMSDGSVWDWGMNSNGKLGDGTVSDLPHLGAPDPWAGGSNDRHIPIQVHGPGNAGYLSGMTTILGGETHNLALKTDGTVWGWGWNTFGQLGNGTFVDSATPVPVSGLSQVKALGGRGYHSLALKQDGTVWAWGLNTSGELGDGSTTNRGTPVQVAGLNGALSVTGGYQHSLALMSDKTLRAWGRNDHGELGNGTSVAYSTSPVTVKNLQNVHQVSAGWEHTAAVLEDGTVWTWGLNDHGELGDGSPINSNVPVQAGELSGVTAVSSGDCHTAALKSDGTVWTWGCNDRGQLGDGSGADQPRPVQVSGLSSVVAIAARDYHNLALKSDGTLWAWGWNSNGQLGDGTTTTRPTPVQVTFGPWALSYLPFIER